MTLLLTIFSAVIATVVWYSNEKARQMKVGVLCYLFCGATIMWFVDAIFEYAELRASYFAPALEDMINDSFLGSSIIALALVIWVIILMVKDPQRVVKQALKK